MPWHRHKHASTINNKQEFRKEYCTTELSCLANPVSYCSKKAQPHSFSFYLSRVYMCCRSSGCLYNLITAHLKGLERDQQRSEGKECGTLRALRLPVWTHSVQIHKQTYELHLFLFSYSLQVIQMCSMYYPSYSYTGNIPQIISAALHG